MPTDYDYREIDIAAVDTLTALTNRGTEAAANFRVPFFARRIRELIMAPAYDFGPGTAGAISVRATCAYHLSGGGVLRGGEYKFIGPSGGAVISDASGGGQTLTQPSRIPVNIAVKPNAEIIASCQMLGEDMGDITAVLGIVYDSGTPDDVGLRVPLDCDYREGDISAVDTLTRLTARGTEAPGNFAIPADVGRIVSVRFANGIDYGTTQVGVRVVNVLHLSGSGFQLAGEYKFVGQIGAGSKQAGISIQHPISYYCNIPVKPNGVIVAESQMIGEDFGDTTVIVELGYG